MRTAHVNDIDIQYELTGRGEPLLLVHGSYSYGATVAIEAAITAPDRVRSLILLEPILKEVPRSSRLFAGMEPVMSRYAAGDMAVGVTATFAGLGGQKWRDLIATASPDADIAGATHLLNLQAPETIAAEAADFLRQHPPSERTPWPLSRPRTGPCPDPSEPIQNTGGSDRPDRLLAHSSLCREQDRAAEEHAARLAEAQMHTRELAGSMQSW